MELFAAGGDWQVDVNSPFPLKFQTRACFLCPTAHAHASSLCLVNAQVIWPVAEPVAQQPYLWGEVRWAQPGLLQALSVPVDPQVRPANRCFPLVGPSLVFFFFSFCSLPFNQSCSVSFISLRAAALSLATAALCPLFGQGVFDLISRSTGWPSHPFNWATINLRVPALLSSFQNKKKSMVQQTNIARVDLIFFLRNHIDGIIFLLSSFQRLCWGLVPPVATSATVKCFTWTGARTFMDASMYVCACAWVCACVCVCTYRLKELWPFIVIRHFFQTFFFHFLSFIPASFFFPIGFFNEQCGIWSAQSTRQPRWPNLTMLKMHCFSSDNSVFCYQAHKGSHKCKSMRLTTAETLSRGHKQGHKQLLLCFLRTFSMRCKKKNAATEIAS